MQFGICQNPTVFPYSAPVHTDYTEMSVPVLQKMKSEDLQSLLEQEKNGTLHTYSCNNLFPADLRLTGPDVDFAKIHSYCDRLFPLLAELNIHMLVFGSGPSKMVPKGFSMEKAWDQLFELGHILSSKAALYGHTIAVEPLSYRAVNIINTVEEAAQYAYTVNQNNFKILVDFYHFDNNKESFASITKHRDLLVHAHIASPIHRSVPSTEADWEFFAKCISFLKQLDYKGNLSFEGTCSEESQISPMFERMKSIYRSLPSPSDK